MSRVGGTALAAALVLTAAGARAEGAPEQAPSTVIWPTLTPAGDAPSTVVLHVPTERSEGVLAERGHIIDALLADTAQDLGLTIDVGRRPHGAPPGLRDADVVEASRASHAWVISPRIERDGGDFVVRLVAAAPGSSVLLVRVERVTADTLPVRVAVMLRDLVRANAGTTRDASGAGPKSNAERDESAREAQSGAPTTRARSAGRAVLALNGATFGGFSGYAMQKASRGDDPRLLYPLVALGTGVGLGASLIVADEWDVGLGDAWYMSAGAWWPAASAALLAKGYGTSPTSDRYAYAFLSGVGGIGLATVALTQGGMGEGSALLTHSGAAFGTALGGATELALRGTTNATPYKGFGYGAAIGVAVSGVLATRLNPSPTRVLLVDMGAALGALAGAAAASPLLLQKETSEGRQRAWVGVTLVGTLIGGGVGYWMTRPHALSPPSRTTSLALKLAPTPTLLPASTPTGAPAFGAQWAGVW